MKVLLAKLALPFVKIWQAYTLKRLEKMTVKKWEVENQIAFREVQK